MALRRRVLVALALQMLAQLVGAQSYTHFESGPVHPIRVSDNGSLLYVCNTPDNRLEVYDLKFPLAPRHLFDVPVGLEPISVTPRTEREVWVVCTLSDSVAVVDVHDRRTIDVLQVPDEPADVVFAGDRAFISASASDLVYAFDAVTREPLGTTAIFGHDPRALVADAAGERVFATVLRSGNRTTIVGPENAPPPPTPVNPQLPPAPKQGLIVTDIDPDWKAVASAQLVDNDVVEIDVATLEITGVFRNVGTILHDAVLDPATDEIYVAGTDARNIERFEPTVAARAIESRVSRLTTGAVFTVFRSNLNQGLEPGQVAGGVAKSLALAEPTGLAFDANERRLFVAAQGTDRVAAFDAQGTHLATIEVGDTPGAAVDTHTKRGPRALAVHPSAPALYVFNLLSHSIGVIDTESFALVREDPLPHDPVPADVALGRRFLYDAKISSHGLMSCASCHVDAEWDGLAWDLGNPSGSEDPGPGPQPPPFDQGLTDFHPIKGPLTTQTLRGLAGVGPYHWRGDRPQLEDFQSGFEGVLLASPLSPSDLDSFVTFLEAITFPPNPFQNLDRTMPTEPAGANAADGETFFHVPTKDIGGSLFSCAECHAGPAGTNQLVTPPAILDSGPDTDQFKVPHLRGLYRKNNPVNEGGFRKAGFGFLHNGLLQDLDQFLAIPLFDEWPIAQKDDIAQFLLAFDTGTAPAVGRQVLVSETTLADPETESTALVLQAQALAGNADVVAKGHLDGLPRGFVYDPAADLWSSDDPALGAYTWNDLVGSASAGTALFTVMGVPPGSGTRIGVDRDDDGLFDASDVAAPFGFATPGCAGEPQLVAQGEPTLGSIDYSIAATNLAPSTFGFWVVGFAQTQLTTNGVTLFVDPADPSFTVLPIAAQASGFARSYLVIPPNPQLVGQVAFLQGVFADPCGTEGLAATYGLRFVVQP